MTFEDLDLTPLSCKWSWYLMNSTFYFFEVPLLWNFYDSLWSYHTIIVELENFESGCMLFSNLTIEDTSWFIRGLFTKSCPTLLWPNGMQSARLLCPWDFSRQEIWSELTFLSSRDLPNLRIEPTSLAWQAVSLPLSHLCKVYKYLLYKLLHDLFLAVLYSGSNKVQNIRTDWLQTHKMFNYN